MEKFRKLGISEHVLKSIEEAKYETPTEIQDKTIPLILEGKDVIAGAATGSGKTLAFGAGIVHVVEHGKGIRALVLTPTRELAEQVTSELTKFSKHKRLFVASVYGGVSINPQIDNLRHADVVVGTPGRILDHMERRTINLTGVKILVLDEADRMLDMGFIDDVERIIRQCPKQRQTMLFSATISNDIARLAKKYMINPIEISAVSYIDASHLEQVYYDIPDNMKFSLLVHLLKQETKGLVMVFCNTQRNTDFIAKNLRHAGLDVLAIHGGHSQHRRMKTMEMFNTNKADVLVCTDVAARGLDIKGVSHIYNYDLPKDSKEYIHRIGRTARAGKQGKAVSLLISRDYDNFNSIIEDDNLKIRKLETPQIERISLVFDHGLGERGRGRFGGGGRFSGGRGFKRNDRGFSRGKDSGNRYQGNERSRYHNKSFESHQDNYNKDRSFRSNDNKGFRENRFEGNRNQSRNNFRSNEKSSYHNRSFRSQDNRSTYHSRDSRENRFSNDREENRYHSKDKDERESGNSRFKKHSRFERHNIHKNKRFARHHDNRY